MQLTLNTDYSLRVLLYVAERPNQLISTKEISEFFQISQNHLVKVVNVLGKLGYLKLQRGRYKGGITLAKLPSEINLGEVIKQIEPLDLLECFDPKNKNCRITSTCKLKGVLIRAKLNFVEELKKTQLSDLLSVK